MMIKKDLKRKNVATISLPKNHLVRKLDKALDFNFIYKEVERLYSNIDAPSVDPVVLIKIVMLQHTFGITSMRETIRDIEVNVAYRWFIGYSLDEKIPALPYRRPMTKKGFFKKYQFVYDEQFDCYICPNYQILNYSTTDRERYQNCKSDSLKCKKYPFFNECTNSKNAQKVITRHI